jgi:hypothetical protein
VFGGDAIDDGLRSGLRGTLGFWLDSAAQSGIEASWFSLFDDTDSGDYSVYSPGHPLLARPFFDTVSGQNASELTAYTDPANVTIAEGSVQILSSSEMHSGSILVRQLFREGSRGRVDLLGGRASDRPRSRRLRGGWHHV